MPLKHITVSYQRSHRLPSGDHVQAEVTLNVSVPPDEKHEALKLELSSHVQDLVHDMLDAGCTASHHDAPFANEPRYDLALTKKRAPRDHRELIIILPCGPNQRPYAPVLDLKIIVENIRHAYARRYIGLLSHDYDRYEIIDCYDGDLSRIPEWARDAAVYDAILAKDQAEAQRIRDEIRSRPRALPFSYDALLKIMKGEPLSFEELTAEANEPDAAPADVQTASDGATDHAEDALHD